MQIKSLDFKRRAYDGMHNQQLQRAFGRMQSHFVDKRTAAVKALPEFDAIRDSGAAIRDRVLENLDVYLKRFEQAAQARGVKVHFAETAEEANRLIADIARENGVRKIVKSKSMVTEECALNEHLERDGFEVVETDLGEYILQLANDTPSHIVAPVAHKSKEEISDLFAEKHQRPRLDSIFGLVDEARHILRPQFLSADMGISGGNFLIAETGSVMIFTNEGNGRLTTTLPRVHVAISGIEKIVPTLEDAATLARLLPRSTSGQAITNYISVLTGPRRPGDLDGPEHMHIVLLDNGRSKAIGTALEPVLRCIRCGACMNHCPVYQNVGGHAYGWVYPGPIGAVLTPLYAGLANGVHLPNASTFCGKCAEVCPVKIPLPDIMRDLRAQQFDRRLRSWSERAMLVAWRWTAERPVFYAAWTRTAARLLSWFGGRKQRLRWLPATEWTRGRDMPAPAGQTFRDLYRVRRARS